MQGLHLTADLSQCRCDAEWLTDAARLGAFCRQAVADAGLQAVGELIHTFAPTPQGPGGVTATVLLAESHLCVHTWPELGAVTLDVYVCNFGADHSSRAHALMQRLQDLFQPSQVQAHALHRGAPQHMTPKALILAAGRGERMRPLTDTTPKPLLPVRGKPLMQWHMQALAQSGVTDVVVNTAWLGTQISERFGATFAAENQPKLALSYSDEQHDFGGALETAGGICRALPLLGDVFWVVAGDVYAPGFTFTPAAVQRFAASDALAHLWLVPNPAHNLKGDFTIDAEGVAGHQQDSRPRYTYSTIGLYRRELFAQPWCDIPPGNAAGVKAPLAPLLRAAMDNRKITAELYHGDWTDVGTPERLAQLNNH